MFAKSLNWMGQPLEYAQNRLPEKVRTAITRASRKAIEKALEFSINTVPAHDIPKPLADAKRDSKKSGKLHTAAAAAVGGVGGLLGLAALPVELPLATVIMLRSIAEIARNYGNDLSSFETKLDCLYVFSLGGKTNHDDAMESAYYTSKVIFSEVLKKSSAYIAGASAKEFLSAVESKSAPFIVRFVAEIAAQFEIRVTKKFLMQTAPVLGAVGGAGLNLLFASFFQECARHHFAMRNLEKTHGIEMTRDIFEAERRLLLGQQKKTKLA